MSSTILVRDEDAQTVRLVVKMDEDGPEKVVFCLPFEDPESDTLIMQRSGDHVSIGSPFKTEAGQLGEFTESSQLSELVAVKGFEGICDGTTLRLLLPEEEVVYGLDFHAFCVPSCGLR